MKIRLTAGLVGFLLLGIAIGPNVLGQASVGVAVLFGIGILVVWLTELRPKKDAYDLAVLKQIHERSEKEKIDDEIAEYQATGRVICLNCAEEYDSRLGQCPRCRKSQF